MTIPEQLDLSRVRKFQAERINMYKEPEAGKRWNSHKANKQIRLLVTESEAGKES